jgi:hypothetical protein
MARLVQTYGTRLRAHGNRLRDAQAPFEPSEPPPDPGDDQALMVLTVTANSAGGAKTHEPFTIMVPLAPGDLPAGRSIRVYDDDGSGSKGAELANYQTTLSSTDFDGQVRLVSLAGIVPSIGAAATRKLHLESSTTAGPTGTAITASDVLSTAAQCLVEFDIGGTVWTFNARDALGAESSFAKVGYQLVLIDSGPTRTRWLASGPPRNGGNAHASGDGLRVSMEITAWKAAPGAVTGGNPITLVEFDAEVMNEDLVRSSANCAHHLYGLAIHRATSLSDGTLITTDDTDADGNVIRYSYPRSAPSAGITLSAATTGTGRTCTRDAGTWPDDILGAYIVAGSGKGVVTARASATQVTLWIVEAFSGTTFSSGQWTVEGVGHHHATRYARIAAVGQKRTSVVLWGDNTSALAPTTRAAMDVLAAKRLALNWSATYASVSHSMTALNNMRASDGSRRPLTVRGPGGTAMGDIETNIGNTGMRPDIGPVPGWCVAGLIRCDADGRRKIFENAEYFATWQRLAPIRLSGSPAAGELGVWPRADNGTTYKYNPAQTGTLIEVPSVTWWPYSGDTAHHPRPFYFAYLLTGRICWLRCMGRQADYSVNLALNSVFNGAGLNGTPYGDPTGTADSVHGEHQVRAKAWTLLDHVMAFVSTPDDLSPKVANPHSYWTTRLAKAWDALKYWGPDDAGGVRFGSTRSPQWLKEANVGDTPIAPFQNPRYDGPWQIWMNLIALGWAKELGCFDADAQAGYEWLLEFPKEVWNSPTTLNRRGVLLAYYLLIRCTSGPFATSQPQDWSDVYRRTCLYTTLSTNSNQQARTPTGSVTLSNAAVGTGRTMTFANGYFGGGSWYVGGVVRETGTNGVFQITAVNSATELVGDVTTAFSGTSLTAANLRIPGPHPSDVVSEYQTISNPNYAQMCVAAMRLSKSFGISVDTMAAIISDITSLSGWTEDTIQFQIAERT